MTVTQPDVTDISGVIDEYEGRTQDCGRKSQLLEERPQKHGATSNAAIVGDENPSEREHHRTRVRESLQPVGAVEEELVDDIAHQFWRGRRLRRHEELVIAATADAVGSKIMDDRFLPAPYDEELLRASYVEDHDDAVAALDIVNATLALDATTVLEIDVVNRVFASLALDLDDRWPAALGHDPTENRWTVAELKAGLVIRAEEVDLPFETFIQEAQFHLRAMIEKTCEELEVDFPRQCRKMELAQLLPPEPAMDRIRRYEASVRREIESRLKLLIPLQDRRARNECLTAPSPERLELEEPNSKNVKTAKRTSVKVRT